MSIRNWASQYFKFDIDKALKLWKTGADYWKKLTGSYIYPNGFLDDIPVYVTNLDYSKGSSVTPNTLFLGEDVIDNIEKSPYDLTIDLICFGKEYLSEIKKLRTLAEDQVGSQNIISFFYQKNKEHYFPLVITNISYSDSSETTLFQSITISLKQVNLALATADDSGNSTLTAVLVTNDSFINSQTEQYEMPMNLFEELRRDVPQFKEVTDAVKNFF